MKINTKFMRIYLGILFLYAIALLNAVAQNGLQDSLDISRELNEVVVLSLIHI